MSDKKAPDYVTDTGIEVYFDMTAITRREWRALFSAGTTEEQDYEIWSRFTGGTLEPDEIGGLNLLEYKRFIRAAMQKANAPLDPN